MEEAFAHWWKVGCVDEDWAAWVDLFVPDVLYHDHFWGPLHGRDEVALWIAAVMKGVPEIYTVLDWYTIDGDTVVFHCENRRDNPARRRTRLLGLRRAFDDPLRRGRAVGLRRGLLGSPRREEDECRLRGGLPAPPTRTRPSNG